MSLLSAFRVVMSAPIATFINYARFIFTSRMAHNLHYLCLLVYSDVPHMVCCVSVCLGRLVSCAPNIASFSGLSIFIAPSVISSKNNILFACVLNHNIFLTFQNSISTSYCMYVKLILF